jgi:hypothetical protein
MKASLPTTTRWPPIPRERPSRSWVRRDFVNALELGNRVPQSQVLDVNRFAEGIQDVAAQRFENPLLFHRHPPVERSCSHPANRSANHRLGVRHPASGVAILAVAGEVEAPRRTLLDSSRQSLECQKGRQGELERELGGEHLLTSHLSLVLSAEDFLIERGQGLHALIDSIQKNLVTAARIESRVSLSQ